VKLRKWLTWLGVGAGLLVVVSFVYVAVHDAGTITVRYAESAQPEHQQLRQSLQQWGGVEAAAARLDASLLLPQSVDVWFADCGQNSALYVPENREIILCYELVRDFVRAYGPYATSDSALSAAVSQTTFFVLYHEVGHALNHILDLPTTGREEDAVDQLATLVLLNGGEEGRNAALQGALWFAGSAQRGQRIPFWDEHGLDEQRYFNIICWVYGSNPEAQQFLLQGDWGLPTARATRCPTEFQRVARAWSSVLKQHTY